MRLSRWHHQLSLTVQRAESKVTGARPPSRGSCIIIVSLTPCERMPCRASAEPVTCKLIQPQCAKAICFSLLQECFILQAQELYQAASHSAAQPLAGMAFSCAAAAPTGSCAALGRVHHVARYPTQLQPSRPSARCSFSFISKLPLPQLFGPSNPSQPQEQSVEHPLYSMDGFEDSSDMYTSLLQQAEDITFNISPAAEQQWAEMRLLQDAERMLVMCIQVCRRLDSGTVALAVWASNGQQHLLTVGPQQQLHTSWLGRGGAGYLVQTPGVAKSAPRWVAFGSQSRHCQSW